MSAERSALHRSSLAGPNDAAWAAAGHGGYRGGRTESAGGGASVGQDDRNQVTHEATLRPRRGTTTQWLRAHERTCLITVVLTAAVLRALLVAFSPTPFGYVWDFY